MNKNISQKTKRATRIRSRILGTKAKPRLSVFRSNKAVTAQLIDDEKKVTLMTLTQKAVTDVKESGKIAIAHALGVAVAKKAKEMKINTAVFDKGSYAYHGRVKALAEGAREGGLKI